MDSSNVITNPIVFIIIPNNNGSGVVHQNIGKCRNVVAMQAGKFREEEQNAFREALFDLKQPGWLGMKINLGEMWRRLRRNK